MSDQDRAPVYVKQGERITCRNGHAIATAARDIKVGEPSDPAQFAFEVEAGQSGATPALCPSCGEPWHQGGLLFIDGTLRVGYQPPSEQQLALEDLAARVGAGLITPEDGERLKAEILAEAKPPDGERRSPGS